MERPVEHKDPQRRRDALALAGLFVLIAGPFGARILAGASALPGLLLHDIGFQWVPFHDFVRRSLADGVLPLWSPEIFAGFPFAAFSHGSVFYPPGLLFLLGDYARVVNFYYPLHLFIAAAGVYALGRTLRLPPLAAFAAAAAYAFTGKPFHFIHFLPATQSNCWLPWLWWGGLNAARGRALGLAAGAAAFALAVTGGDVESTAYGLCFGAVAVAIWARAEGLPLRRVLIAEAPLLLGGLLAAAQLMPLAELSRWFVRDQGMTFDYFSRRELPAAVAYALFAPARAIGDYPLDGPYFYLGAAVFGLALAAAVGRAERSSRPLFALTAFVFAFSFGSLSFLDRLQYSLPLLRSFGSPEQSFYVGQILLAVLAGQGLAAAGRDRRGLMTAGVCLLLFAAVEGLIGWRDGLMGWGWIGLAATVVAGAAAVAALKFPGPPGSSPALVSPASSAEEPEPKQSSGAEKRKQSFRTPNPALAATLIAAAVVLDVWLLAVAHLPRSRVEDFSTPGWLGRMSRQISPATGRAVFISRLGIADPELVHHAGMRLGFDLIDGWITTPVRSYVEVLALADKRVAQFKDGKLDYLGLNDDLRDGRFIDAPGMPILDLIGLRWIVDRGLPIKFASPAFLEFIPPQYRRRQISEAGLAPDPPAGERPSLTFAANETLRLRLFIEAGDQLRLAPLVVGGGDTVELRIDARPVDGTTVTIFSRRQTASRARASSFATETIPLDMFNNRQIELTLSTQAKPGSDSTISWGPAAIVNNSRTIQFVPIEQTPLLYENRDALPRGFVVRDFEVVPAGETVARLKTMPAYDLRRKLLLARSPRNASGDEMRRVAGAKAGRAAELIRRRSGEEVWKVEAPQPALLFVSDQYYPGWRAFAGDEERAIIRADHAFRAVPVGPGDLTVRFVYQPVSVRVGLWASFSSVLAMAAMVIIKQRKGKGKK